MASAVIVTAFFCGAYAVISQAYLAREFLVVFLGNEMSLAVLLGGWLGGVAAGARLGRTAFVTRRAPAQVMIYCLAAWVVALPAAVLSVRMSRAILGINPGNYASLGDIAVVAFGFVGAFSSLGGFGFVTLCRLADRGGAGRPIAAVYVFEAAGSVGGGIISTFCLAGRHGPFAAAFAAYPVMGALGAGLALAAWRRAQLGRRTAVTLGIGTCLLACAGLGVLLAGRHSVIDRNSALARMQTIAKGFAVDTAETRYQSLTTLMLSGQYTVYGNGDALMTFPEPLLEQQEAYTALTQHGSARRVLVIGGGPSFLSAVLSYGVESVDYVELDPGVVEVFRRLKEGRKVELDAVWALDSPAVHIHYGDARAFVESAAAAGTRWDVIIVRMPDPSTLFLNRLYTIRFMAYARRALTDGGILVLPVTLADGYVSGEVGRYAGDIYRTMRVAFAQVLATPEVRSLFMGCGRAGVLTGSAEELSRRYAARGPASEIFPALFQAIYPEERTSALAAALAGMRAGPVNSDWTPTTYAANLVLWSRYSGSPIAGRLLSLSLHPRLLAAVLLLAGIAGAVWSIGRRGIRRAARTAVTYTGASAMSMSVLLLYVFQIECGYIYNWIGMLSAAFIGGLAAGGLVGSRMKPSARRLVAAEIVAAATPVLVLCALAVLGFYFHGDAAKPVVIALAVLAGISTGFEFPVAAGVLAAEGAKVEQAASRLQISDQIGACAGALLAGIVVIPALGVYGTLWLLAGLKAASCAAVVLAARRASLP